MTEPRFIVDIPGPPDCWEFISDRYFLGWGYERGRFCWNHFRRRQIVFIQDRNKTGLCQSCASKLREARKRRDRRRLPKASGPSNAERGEETRRRIVELLEENGGAMPAPEMEQQLGVTRDTIRWHALRGLKKKLHGSIGPNRCRWWELVA